MNEITLESIMQCSDVTPQDWEEVLNSELEKRA